MVWSAYLTRTANSDDLRDPNPEDGCDPAERPAAHSRGTGHAQRSTDAQIFFRHVRPLGASAGTGLFTVEYVRGDEVLSLGSFLIQ